MRSAVFNEKRAAQAAAIFAKNAKGRILDKYQLCKMMYYLERETIVRTGQPLFHDELYSAPYGPIASEVNHSINAIVPPKNTRNNYHQGRHPAWEDHFTRVGETSLHLNSDPGDDELSISDINLINEIWETFEKFSFDELEDFFHNLPEYQKTDSNHPITFKDILTKVAKATDEEVEMLLAEYNYFLGVVNI